MRTPPAAISTPPTRATRTVPYRLMSGSPVNRPMHWLPMATVNATPATPRSSPANCTPDTAAQLLATSSTTVPQSATATSGRARTATERQRPGTGGPPGETSSAGAGACSPIHRPPTTATAIPGTAVTARWSRMSTPAAADAVASAPAATPPRLHMACIEDRTDRPAASWARTPATFCPTSTTASTTPTTNSARARKVPEGDQATAATATARTTVPTTETGTGPHRAMSRGGSAEEQIDPTAQQETISPNRD